MSDPRIFVEAIKEIRSQTGHGLKAAVDAYRETNSVPAAVELLGGKSIPLQLRIAFERNAALEARCAALEGELTEKRLSVTFTSNPEKAKDDFPLLKGAVAVLANALMKTGSTSLEMTVENEMDGKFKAVVTRLTDNGGQR